MNVTAPAVPTVTLAELPLIAQQQLLINRTAEEDVLQIVAANGQVQLMIRITPDGPVLDFSGTGLKLRTRGTLAIDAQKLELHGREGVSITSGGDAQVTIAGDLAVTAQAHTLEATLGNVYVKANDDVRLNGERVMVNC